MPRRQLVCLDDKADATLHLRGPQVPEPGSRRGRARGATRFLAYAIEDEQIQRRTRYYERCRLLPINRTVRGSSRQPDVPA